MRPDKERNGSRALLTAEYARRADFREELGFDFFRRLGARVRRRHWSVGAVCTAGATLAPAGYSLGVSDS